MATAVFPRSSCVFWWFLRGMLGQVCGVLMVSIGSVFWGPFLYMQDFALRNFLAFRVCVSRCVVFLESRPRRGIFKSA